MKLRPCKYFFSSKLPPYSFSVLDDDCIETWKVSCHCNLRIHRIFLRILRHGIPSREMHWLINLSNYRQSHLVEFKNIDDIFERISKVSVSEHVLSMLPVQCSFTVSWSWQWSKLFSPIFFVDTFLHSQNYDILFSWSFVWILQTIHFWSVFATVSSVYQVRFHCRQ